MTNQLQVLRSLTPDSETLTGRRSPATSLTLVNGWDDTNNWETFICLSVGDRIVTNNGNGSAWRVIGFTKQSGIILVPFGLDSDSDIVWAEATTADGFQHLPAPIASTMMAGV